ncbi:hypothetical protein Q428_01260 [Fervidicella metallireducens AeB]|uniref:Uncharacterized protein n=1 Tax=Fervidicella metallireducens AeB TaxID=1403537 RepID=A0A017S0L4_9CLOT|nr:hypothetical protein [Fervidicella metallireducens]EYE89725.1 hypothetical protein Q428_01260 [Fervidicella metallireducens AeB]
MEVKCPTCGYMVKDSTVCPRCRTKLFDCLKCSGNCLKCSAQKNKRSAE